MITGRQKKKMWPCVTPNIFCEPLMKQKCRATLSTLYVKQGTKTLCGVMTRQKNAKCHTDTYAPAEGFLLAQWSGFPIFAVGSPFAEIGVASLNCLDALP